MANSGGSRRKKAGTRAESSEETVKPGSEQKRRTAGSTAQQGAGQQDDTLAAALLGLSKLYGQSGDGGSASQVTDAITQAVLMLLGTGPAIGAYQGLLSAQNSNGVMFHQSVANQQRLNMLGMCTTAKCVRYMFDGDPDDIMDVETVLNEAGKA